MWRMSVTARWGPAFELDLGMRERRSAGGTGGITRLVAVGMAKEGMWMVGSAEGVVRRISEVSGSGRTSSMRLPIFSSISSSFIGMFKKSEKPRSGISQLKFSTSESDTTKEVSSVIVASPSIFGEVWKYEDPSVKEDPDLLGSVFLRGSAGY